MVISVPFFPVSIVIYPRVLKLPRNPRTFLIDQRQRWAKYEYENTWLPRSTVISFPSKSRPDRCHGHLEVGRALPPA